MVLYCVILLFCFAPRLPRNLGCCFQQLLSVSIFWSCQQVSPPFPTKTIYASTVSCMPAAATVLVASILTVVVAGVSADGEVVAVVVRVEAVHVVVCGQEEGQVQRKFQLSRGSSHRFATRRSMIFENKNWVSENTKHARNRTYSRVLRAFIRVNELGASPKNTNEKRQVRQTTTKKRTERHQRIYICQQRDIPPVSKHHIACVDYLPCSWLLVQTPPRWP